MDHHAGLRFGAATLQSAPPSSCDAVGSYVITAQLVAVQAKMSLDHYRDAAAFRRKVLELTEEAILGLDRLPTLIAFPEAIGFPLLLTLSGNPNILRSRRLTQAITALGRGELASAVRTMAARRIGPLRALYHLRAKDAFVAYAGAFAEAARFARATIVGGTIFLPQIELEASRGLHVAADVVRNTAFTFAPSGLLLDRTHKRYLTAGLESRVGLVGSDAAAVHTFTAPVGKVGIAICLDGFYGSTFERLDGLEATVVVQPSANFAKWSRPWPADSNLCEGDAWFARGLRSQIQDRMHIRVGVNPMLVAELWDLEAEGRSSIVVNHRFQDAAVEGLDGMLAVASSCDRQEVVRAKVTTA